jgi:nucleoside-diphosphate kinase
MCQLSKSDAESFYAIHSGKHFFQGLTSYMCSAPIVAMELMAANGISKWRQLLGVLRALPPQTAGDSHWC